MKRKVLRLTPAILKRIISEEKQKIIIEKNKIKKKKLNDKQLVESLKKLMLLKKAQKRAGKDFQRIFEQREKIKMLIRESYNGRK